MLNLLLARLFQYLLTKSFATFRHLNYLPETNESPQLSNLIGALHSDLSSIDIRSRSYHNQIDHPLTCRIHTER